MHESCHNDRMPRTNPAEVEEQIPHRKIPEFVETRIPHRKRILDMPGSIVRYNDNYYRHNDAHSLHCRRACISSPLGGVVCAVGGVSDVQGECPLRVLRLFCGRCCAYSVGLPVEYAGVHGIWKTKCSSGKRTVVPMIHLEPKKRKRHAVLALAQKMREKVQPSEVQEHSKQEE